MITLLLGKKVGMTQIFDERGGIVPVTVLQAGPCSVVQVKKSDGPDGYNALQLGFDDKKKKSLNKPEIGHFDKAGVSPKYYVSEIPWDGEGEVKVGDSVTVDVLSGYKFIDVAGTSKGRGFAGTIKRHGFHRQPKTHGQSDRERAPGSIGASAWPSRVFKGKRMSGHYGASRVMAKGLEVVQLRPEENLVFVKGSVPGPNGGYIEIRRGLKENIIAYKAAKKKK